MAQEKRPLAHELLSRAFAPEEAERIYVEKVKQKPLFLRPTEPDASNNRERRRRERARKLLQRKQKQKPKPLSAKEKRVLKIYDVPKEARKYKIYEPLHRMWVGYIQEVLGEGCLPVTPSMVVKLCSADFHGARIEVVRSRCVSRVGLKGIVVKDTKFTFEVVTIKDEVKGALDERIVWQEATCLTKLI